MKEEKKRLFEKLKSSDTHKITPSKEDVVSAMEQLYPQLNDDDKTSENKADKISDADSQDINKTVIVPNIGEIVETDTINDKDSEGLTDEAYEYVEAEKVDEQPIDERTVSESVITDTAISKVAVRKIKETSTATLNGFDMFFVKLWAYIVAFITALSNGINWVIKLITKRKVPDRYLKAVVSVIIVILLILLFTLPFKIEVSAGDKIDIYSEGLLPVAIKDKWGYIDEAGNIKISAVYEEALPFMQGVAWVRTVIRDDNDKVLEDYWCLIDKKGKPKGKDNLKFDSDVMLERPVGEFTAESNLAWVYVSGKYGYIKNNGSYAITPRFVEAETFCNGLARVKMGSIEYYINKRGDMVGNAYDKVMTFSEGYGAVMINESWGFVDAKGNVVIDPQYDAVTQFKGGYSAVRNGLSYGIIDYKGRHIVELSRYNDLQPLSKAMKELIDSIKLDR